MALAIQHNDQNLKAHIYDILNQTDDLVVLKKVFNTLTNGNLYGKISDIIVGNNQNAKEFSYEIHKAFEQSNHSIDQKNDFLNRYSSGILNLNKLLSGDPYDFESLTGSPFAATMFVELSKITSYGVGPGEVALSILGNTNVIWSGRSSGGGDIIVDNQKIEVKTSVAAGGRWVNARKANMNLSAIPNVIKEHALHVVDNIPARTSPNYWVNNIRTNIKGNSDVLEHTASVIANSVFTYVDNTKYVDALIHGNSSEIIDSILEIGYENYKAYSGFDGMLMIDLKSQTAQYFINYEDMRNRIKVDTTYIYAPESEIMPKIKLLPAENT